MTLHPALLFILGLASLVGGAELLVRGASRMALSLGIAPLVVGLTIVAFGTSAPEVAVSVGAAMDGTTDLAIGNVVGSNIFNILLILGLSAIIVPLSVHAQIIRQEVPVMIGATVLLVALILDGSLSRVEGALLLLTLAAYTFFLIRQARSAPADESAALEAELPAAGGWDSHWAVQLLMMGAGLALLVLGSGALVEAATAAALAMGVSELVIGLTIVAAGTSMPEVATSIMAAIRGQRDIAVGNVIGSNVFNLLGCLGAASVVSNGGLVVPPALLNFDLWVLLAVSLACLPIFITGREIARWEGGVFMLYYAAYTAYLIMAAQQHAALTSYTQVMLSVVIPLTIITLVTVFVKERRH